MLKDHRKWNIFSFATILFSGRFKERKLLGRFKENTWGRKLYQKKNSCTSGGFLWILRNFYEQLFFREHLRWVSGQLSPKENCPPVRVGVLVKVRVSFRVGGNQTIAPEENCLPASVRSWVRVSFGVGGQFSSGAIVLEPLRWVLLYRRLFLEYSYVHYIMTREGVCK